MVEIPIPQIPLSGFLSLRMLWTDPDEILSMLEMSWRVIILFLKISSLTLFTFWSVWLFDNCPAYSASSAKVTPLLNMEKAVKNFCSSHFLLFKSYFQHCSIFPHFKVKLDADMLFLQVCHFPGTPKLQMEHHTLVLNKMSFNSHKCYSLTASKK